MAGDVEALGALGHGTAEDEILDLRGVQGGGAGQRLAHGRDRQLLRARFAQGAARRPADGGPGG